MQCPKCKMVEMWVEKIENSIIYYVCKKCGTTAQEEVPQEKSN